MTAGRFRHRVEFQQRLRNPDGMGGTGDTWAMVARVWASVVQEAGRETMKADKILSTSRYLIKIRFRAGLRPDMRIVWGDKILHILSVADPDGKRRFAEIVTEAHDG